MPSTAAAASASASPTAASAYAASVRYRVINLCLIRISPDDIGIHKLSVNMGEGDVLPRFSQSGKDNNKAEIGKQGQDHSQKSVADVFHRPAYLLALKQFIDFIKCFLRTVVIVFLGGVAVYIVRYRLL